MDKGRQSFVQKCLLCNQPYSSRHALNKGGRVPLVLHCGHSACDSCISKALNKPGTSLTCQKCNVETKASDDYVPGKPELEFPYNSLIFGQMVLKSHSLWEDDSIAFSTQSKPHSDSSVTMCHECADKKAEVHCQQCQVPYCDPCFKRIHQVAKAFKGHVRMSVLESGVILETKCSAHNQLVQFWCEQCCLALCSNCLLASHKDHPVILLVDKNTSCKKELIEVFTKVSNVCTRLKSTRKNALASLPKSESENCKEVERSVREHFERLHGLLINRQKTILNNLYSPTQDSANNVNSILKQIDHFLQELSVDLKKASVMIQNESKYIYSVPYTDMLHTLKSRESTPCFLTVSSENLDSTKFVFDESIYDQLKSHGQLDVSDNKARFRLVTEDELPSDFPIDPIKSSSLDSIIKTFQEASQDLESDDAESLSGKVSSLSISPSQQSRLRVGPSNQPTLPSEPGPFFPPTTSSQPGNYQRAEQRSRGVGYSSETDFAENDDVLNRTQNELSEGCKVRVTVTHATSPSDFYVRKIGTDRKLLDINLAFSKLNLKVPLKDRVRPGDYFMARYSQDGRWYRSTVLSIENNKIRVFYIDFGNSEFLPRESLRLIPHSLMKCEGMALHCCLHDCIPIEEQWSTQAISTMVKISFGEMMMTVKQNTPDLLHVDLSKTINLDSISIGKSLVFLGLARHENPETPSFMLETVKFQRHLPAPEALVIGQVLDILITHCVSPHEFYIQHRKNFNTIKGMMSGLQEMYAKKSERMIIQQPKIGMLVAAMNSCENEWRRARIIGIPEQRKVKVLYVDFGDSEVISYKRTRHLGHKFFNTAIQCFKCQLSDVAPLEGETWSNEAKEVFASLIHFQPKYDVQLPEVYKARINLVVVGNAGDSVDCLLFKIEIPLSININAVLAENVAQSTGPNSQTLEVDTKMITKIGSQVKKHKGKNAWAGISADCSETMSEVREILLSQMQSCSSSSLVTSSHTDSELRSGCSSSVSPVPGLFGQDYLSSADTGTLSSAGEEDVAARVQSVTGGEGETIKIQANIVRVVSPSEFYVMLAPLVPKIKHMKKQMQKFYSDAENRKSPTEVKTENAYAVRRDQDNLWCRAFTISLSENSAEVILPDFGETIEVDKSDIYELDAKFQQIKDGVIKCHLGGLKGPLDGSWPLTTTDEIKEYADKYINRIYITKLGLVKENSLPTEILVKEEVTSGALEPTKVTWTSLNNNLRMRGLAVSDGTVDWDLEEYSYTSFPKQTSSSVYKGMLISCVNPSNNKPDIALTEDVAESWSVFGSVVKLAEGNEASGSSLRSDSNLGKSRELMTSSQSSLLNTSFQEGDDEPQPGTSLTLKSNIPETFSPVPIPAMPEEAMPKAWLPPLPFIKLEFIANPTNVEHDASIFIQDFQRSVGSLKRIGEILDMYCRMSLPMSDTEMLSVGDTVLARYHLDQKWYRGVIKEIKINIYMVELVDYGNTEEVLFQDLRKLSLATEFPLQGRFCRLKLKPNTADGKWTVPVLDMIHSFVVEKHCLVKLWLDNFDHTYYIESCKLPTGSDLITELIVRGYGVLPEEPPEKIVALQSDDAGSVSKSSNDDLLSVNSSSSFSDIKIISTIELKNAEPKDMSDIKVKESAQDLNIVEVVEPTPDEESTSEEIQTSRSTDIPDNVNQARYDGQLKSGESLDTSLSDDDLDESKMSFQGLKISKSVDRLTVEVQSVFPGPPEMIRFQVISSNDDTLTQSRETFQEVYATIQERAASQPMIRFPQINDICCAQFSSDDCWYRAMVLDVPKEETVVVKYVDYGNVEELPISKIREMDISWMRVETQLFEARLHNIEVIPPESQWNQVRDRLTQSLLDKTFTAKLFEREPVLSVELYDGDNLAYQDLIDDGLFRLVNN